MKAEDWQQWKELERHLDKITVMDVLLSQVYTGRLQELTSNLPAGLFKKIRAIWRQRHTRRAYARHIRKVNANFKDKTVLLEPHKNEGGNPLDNPFITWYSYYFDLLSHEQGVSLDEYNNMPFSSLDEHKLAIGARKAQDSGRASLENNLNSKGAKYLNSYPKRLVDQAVYMSLQKSKEQMKKEVDEHFKGREAIYKN